MEDIVLRQRNAAKPLTGKTFLLSVAGIVLRLAIVQIVIGLLISATGLEQLSLLLYLCSALVLYGFMRSVVASYVYTLRDSSIVLEKKMGDSTVSGLEIPLESIVSMRPVKRGERLKTAYTQVTVIDPGTRPPLRVRMGFVISLFSARLAYLFAGRRPDEDLGVPPEYPREKEALYLWPRPWLLPWRLLRWALWRPLCGIMDKVGGGIYAVLVRICAGKQRLNEEIGFVLVYTEENKRRACTFMPDEKMCEAIAQRIGPAYGFDERMTHARVNTLYARALQRAFPVLYPYVDPLLSEEAVIRAHEELKARKEAEAKAAAEKKAGGTKDKKDCKAKAQPETQMDKKPETTALRRRKQG